jgi:hypothetical protein
MWSIEQATSWWEQQPWLVGCNFIPSTAINQLEMWQPDTFDLATIERELAWGAELGLNIVRVYLHDLLWDPDPDGFATRIDRFLDVSGRHGIAVMFVLFDDVWGVDAALGPQPAPYPGRHNSGWVQSPGLAALRAYDAEPAVARRLERYVRGVVSRFAQDERVLVWDVYNEPGGYPSPRDQPVGEACLPLLRDVFGWVRDSSPSQPLTCGLWSSPVKALPPSIPELQLTHSDVVSFHHYGPPEELQRECDRLRGLTDRPLLCTEYLARPLKSRFETHLPIFQERKIGAIHWGLVSGKTQTIYPWWTWFDEAPSAEPELWFHDVLRSDGSAFDREEVEFLRRYIAAQR